MLNLHKNTQPSYLQSIFKSLYSRSRGKTEIITSSTSLLLTADDNEWEIAILKCGIGNESWATARLLHHHSENPENPEISVWSQMVT